MAKNKRKLPFMRAYELIMRQPSSQLSAAEKLVLVALCRFGPKPTAQSNRTIARCCGYTRGNVEKILRNLEHKGLIRRLYKHRSAGDIVNTRRAIVPVLFGEQTLRPGSLVEPASSAATCAGDSCQSHPDGLVQNHLRGHPPTAGPMDGYHQACRSQTIQAEDLLKQEDKNIIKEPIDAPAAPPTPVPAEQAPASRCPQKTESAERFVRQLAERFRKRWAPLTERQFEKRRQQQLRALRASTARRSTTTSSGVPAGPVLP